MEEAMKKHQKSFDGKEVSGADAAATGLSIFLNILFCCLPCILIGICIFGCVKACNTPDKR